MKLDLHNAYHLVRIKERDEWKTLGHFKYRDLPFELINAPAVFQVLVNILKDMLNIFICVYLDDILVFQVHVQHICHVLQRLLENRLFVKAVCFSCQVSHIPWFGSICRWH